MAKKRKTNRVMVQFDDETFAKLEEHVNYVGGTNAGVVRAAVLFFFAKKLANARTRRGNRK